MNKKRSVLIIISLVVVLIIFFACCGIAASIWYFYSAAYSPNAQLNKIRQGIQRGQDLLQQKDIERATDQLSITEKEYGVLKDKQDIDAKIDADINYQLARSFIILGDNMSRAEALSYYQSALSYSKDASKYNEADFHYYVIAAQASERIYQARAWDGTPLDAAINFYKTAISHQSSMADQSETHVMLGKCYEKIGIYKSLRADNPRMVIREGYEKAKDEYNTAAGLNYDQFALEEIQHSKKMLEYLE